MTTIRRSRLDDGSALAKIDAATWTTAVSPAPAPSVGTSFFGNRTRPEEVLVAEADGVVVGYVKLGQDIPLASHDHVLEVRGLAVDPERHGQGLGRRLVEAALEEALECGAHKLSLRVLSSNDGARRLYAASGFVVEGILRGEFRLAGAYVDDILMARYLGPDAP